MRLNPERTPCAFFPEVSNHSFSPFLCVQGDALAVLGGSVGIVPSTCCSGVKGWEEQTGESFSLVQNCLGFFHLYLFISFFLSSVVLQLSLLA